MSGFEIAGVILGGFPLLISAAEHYKKGFEPLVKWKRFRKDFIEFIDAIDTERLLYSQTIERFLISADVPDEELRCFMTDQRYDGWHREDIAKLLQRRLGPSFAVYMSTIQTMEHLLIELQALLLLKNGVVEWAQANDWDYQLKRIQLSFSKRGERIVTSLESHNRKLRELLDSSDRLQCLKATRRDTAWASIYHCIRKHADSLYTALKVGFSCECGIHTTSLRLEQRKTSDWSSKFYLTLTIPKEPNLPVDLHQEVVIDIQNSTVAGDVSYLSRSYVSNTQQIQADYVSKLRHDFERNVPAHLRPAPAYLKPASDKTLQVPQSTPIKHSDKGLLGMFRKSVLKLSVGNSTNRKDTEVSKTKQLPSVSLPRRDHKQKKSVRINMAVSPNESPDHFGTAKASLSAASPTEPGNYTEIKEFCTIIRSQARNGGCLGYLNDGIRHHAVRPVPAECQKLQDGSYVSLDNLLRRDQPSKLSRQQRFKLANIFASSFLQLQTTPWLAENLSKKNIYFYRQGSIILAEYPYIQQCFSSAKPSLSTITKTQAAPLSQSITTRFNVRGDLNSLGILLLELCFGQPIEEQESRKRYLGPDGKAHEFTDYLTARDWAEMVCEEEPQLEQAIKCCISCFFEGTPDWENKKFTQAVWASVVEPLDSIVKKWDVTANEVVFQNMIDE